MEKSNQKDYMGMISWNRLSCGAPQAMFGSEIKTDSPVCIRISRAYVDHDLDYEMQHAEEDRQRHQKFNDYLSGFKKEIAALGMTEDEHRSKVYEILEKKHGRKVDFEMNEQGNYDGFIEDCYKEGINPEYVADGIVNADSTH